MRVCDSTGCYNTVICSLYVALYYLLPVQHTTEASESPRVYIAYWSATMCKQIHRFLRPEGSITSTQWFHISLSAGIFEQNWKRTVLEETDILILHKVSIEQKYQVKTLFF